MATTFGFKEQKKKIMIVCQGEGKGHLTQAIAFFEAAKDCDVRVYITNNDSIPKYADKLNYKTFDSLTFKFNKDGSVNNISTFFNNIRNIPKIVKSAACLRKEYKEFCPDMVINFYEVLGGLLFPDSISIAHQYKFLHPDYNFPKNILCNFFLKAFTKLTCLRSKDVYALSWYDMRDYGKIKVIPPILRKEIYQESKCNTENEDFILAYAKGDFIIDTYNWGLINEKRLIIYNSNIAIVGNNRSVSVRLASEEFIDKIKHCTGYISNAGFESIAEALLWKKQVFVDPIRGQYEQVCNANDLRINGLGKVRGNTLGFTLIGDMVSFIYQRDVSSWIKKGEFICDSIINNTK